MHSTQFATFHSEEALLSTFSICTHPHTSSPSTVSQTFNYTCTLLRGKERCFSRSWNHCSVHSKHILTVWVTSSSSAYISSVTGSDDLCPPLLIGDLCFSSDLLSRALNLLASEQLKPEVMNKVLSHDIVFTLCVQRNYFELQSEQWETASSGVHCSETTLCARSYFASAVSEWYMKLFLCGVSSSVWALWYFRAVMIYNKWGRSWRMKLKEQDSSGRWVDLMTHSGALWRPSRLRRTVHIVCVGGGKILLFIPWVQVVLMSTGSLPSALPPHYCANGQISNMNNYLQSYKHPLLAR